MQYVVLDTCVLVNCSLLNAEDADPELLVTISDRIREREWQLLLPAVIELEYRRKVPEVLALIRQQTQEFRKAITTQLLTARDVSALHQALDQIDSARDAAVARAQRYFSELAADEDLTIRIPLTGDILAEATEYVLAGAKPAKSMARGLLDADCLIVASIASFARSLNLAPADTVLICSDNHTDFGVWDEDADQHVVALDIAAAIPCSVLYYKSPRTLLEEELELDVEADEPLAQALGEYEDRAKTAASVAALNALTDLVSARRTWNADLSKYLTVPAQPDLLKNLGIPPDLSKYLTVPAQPDLLKNLGIPPDLSKYLTVPAQPDLLKNLGITLDLSKYLTVPTYHDLLKNLGIAPDLFSTPEVEGEEPGDTTAPDDEAPDDIQDGNGEEER